MNKEENTNKSYKKNDLIAVLRKDDKTDPIYLFQLSQNADSKSKKIKGIIYDKASSEKNKVNFEKGVNSSISYEDILASVAPNLPETDTKSLNKPVEFKKYFLTKTNYSKLLNVALENIQMIEKKEEESKNDKAIEIEEEKDSQKKTRKQIKKILGPKNDSEKPESKKKDSKKKESKEKNEDENEPKKT